MIGHLVEWPMLPIAQFINQEEEREAISSVCDTAVGYMSNIHTLKWSIVSVERHPNTFGMEF